MLELAGEIEKQKLIDVNCVSHSDLWSYCMPGFLNKHGEIPSSVRLSDDVDIASILGDSFFFIYNITQSSVR